MCLLMIFAVPHAQSLVGFSGSAYESGVGIYPSQIHTHREVCGRYKKKKNWFEFDQIEFCGLVF